MSASKTEVKPSGVVVSKKTRASPFFLIGNIEAFLESDKTPAQKIKAIQKAHDEWQKAYEESIAEARENADRLLETSRSA